MPLQSLFAQISFGGTPPSWNQQKSKLKTAKELKSNLIENPFTIEQLIEIAIKDRDEVKSQEMSLNASNSSLPSYSTTTPSGIPLQLIE